MICPVGDLMAAFILAPPHPQGLTMLHHIALGAQDVEAVASFYIDVLGLELCKGCRIRQAA